LRLQDVLGATPVHGPPMMMGDSVMHYAMNIGGSTLMLSDVMPGMPEICNNHAYVYVPDVDASCKKAADAGTNLTANSVTAFEHTRMSAAEPV
jgi:uncharacterized glyoxalase superfamily protein PhnB